MWRVSSPSAPVAPPTPMPVPAPAPVAAPPSPAPPPPSVPPAPPAPKESVETVHFDSSSARLTNIAKAKLDEVALRMQQAPGSTLVIRGSVLTSAPPEKTLLYQLAVSGVLLTAAGVAVGEQWPAAPSALALSMLGFQTVVVTFASYLLWFWLVRHYPATQISSFVLLTPVFGLLAGALLLTEPVTARLLVALATVSVGIAVVGRAPRPRAASSATSLSPTPPPETSR